MFVLDACCFGFLDLNVVLGGLEVWFGVMVGSYKTEFC